MTRPLNQQGIFKGRVVRRREPCRAHFEVTLAIKDFPHADPGQFVQVRCNAPFEGVGSQPVAGADGPGAIAALERVTGPRLILRRPMSIAALRRNRQQCEIDLLGRAVGVGTGYLAALSVGDPVDVLGPLGRGFSAPRAGLRALLVAGGIGLPPIRWLGEKLRGDGVVCDAIYGAVTRDSLAVTLVREPSTKGDWTPCVDEFARHGIQTAITTDDGTCGLRGRVTDAAARYLATCSDTSSIQIYACGPAAMLRAIAALCAESGVDGQIAMERMMGCGIGTCQSCVVRLTDASTAQGWRYALCCTEGPVFDASRVIWT
jgi:dihydroorotate dehydrogenase electron transfer subunit